MSEETNAPGAAPAAPRTAAAKKTTATPRRGRAAGKPSSAGSGDTGPMLDPERDDSYQAQTRVWPD
jgi:hypothetical protein